MYLVLSLAGKVRDVSSSAEEKGRMADAAKVAARKLKVQSKRGSGKVM